MKKHYRKETNCLNCGTQLEGHFCHNCGQENLEIKESFGHIMNHAISDYFHFDHQFFHTLQPLLFKPGKLTNEYMAGKRTQYLHPIKMYIFISLIYFILLFKHNNHEAEKADKQITQEQIDTAVKNVDTNEALSSSQKKFISKAILSQADKKSADNDKHGQAVKLTTKSQWKGILQLESDSTYEAYLKRQSQLPANERDGFIKRYIIKKNYDYQNKYGNNAEEVFWEDFKHNVPKMMFVILPLFALLLKITFWNNRKFYVEHLIFSFHLHCFLFLLFTIIMLISTILPNNWGSDWLDLGVTVATIWYIYKALKNVYHRSRSRTISKMLGIGFAYFFVFMFCLGGLLIITALTMK